METHFDILSLLFVLWLKKCLNYKLKILKIG